MIVPLDAGQAMIEDTRADGDVVDEVAAGLLTGTSEAALVVTPEGRTLVVRLLERVGIGEVDTEAFATDAACEELVLMDMLGARLLVVAILLVPDKVVVELLVVDVA